MSLLLLLTTAGQASAGKPLVTTAATPSPAPTSPILLRNAQAAAGGVGPAPSLRAMGTVTSGSTGSPSFAAPAGAQASDVILVAYSQDDSRTTSTAPAGFTLAPDLRQTNNPVAGAPAHSLYVWWGRFSDVGAGPYVFTVVPGGGGATPFVEGRTAAIKDCVTTGNPFEAADGNTSGITAVTTAPAVSGSSTGPNRYAAYFATNWSGGAWTPASGFTEQWDANTQIITFDDQQLPSATTVTPQAVCASSNDSNAWVGIMLPVSSGVVASPTASPIVITAAVAAAAGMSILLYAPAPAPAPVTPQPYVVTTPTPTPAGQTVVLRSTLADPPVLTTESPQVVTAPVAAPPGAALLLRGPLVDVAPASTTTPAPIVVTAPQPAAASTSILLRTVPAALPGQQPTVVTAAAASPPPAAILLRASLADAPVLTTASPTVVTAASAAAPAAATLLRAPQPAAVAQAAATPGPIVITSTAPPVPAAALVLRGSLADAPVLTTVAPLVVTAPTLPPAAAAILARNPQPAAAIISGPTTEPIVVTQPGPPPAAAAILLRSSLLDVPVATPGPLVVTSPAPIRVPLAILARGSLADAPVLTTPSPLVVTTPAPPPRPAALLGRNPLPFVAPVSGPVTAPIIVTAVTSATAGQAFLLRTAPAAGTAPRTPTVTVDLARAVATADLGRTTVTADLTRPSITVAL